MSATSETTPGTGSTSTSSSSTETKKESVDVAKVREEVRKEAETVKKGTEQEKKNFIQRLLSELKRGSQSGKEFLEAESKGKGADRRNEAQTALRTLAQAAEAAKEGIKVAPNEKAQAVLTGLAENPDILTEVNSSEILSKLGPYLFGDKEIVIGSKDNESEFDKTFKSFASESKSSADVVREALKKKAAELGTTGEVIEEKFAPKPITQPDQTIDSTSQQPTSSEDIEQKQAQQELKDKLASMTPIQQAIEMAGEQSWASDWQQLYLRRFPNRMEFLHKLYSPTEFIKYVQDKINPRDEAGREHMQHDKEHIRHEVEKQWKVLKKQFTDSQSRELFLEKEVDRIWRLEVSEGVVNEIRGVIDQLYTTVYKDKPDKFFQEKAQEDYMRGIQTTQNALNTAIQTLSTNLDIYQKNGVPGADIKLFQHFEEEATVEDRQFNPAKKAVLQYLRNKPLIVPNEVSIGDFTQFMFLEMSHMVHSREYTHNGKAVFLHPGGEQGIWGNLAHYAEEFTTSDLDALSYLPDGPLAYEAERLYEKFLDNKFAENNWRHGTNWFVPGEGGVNSQVEDQVLRYLKMKYQAGKDMNATDYINDERLLNAVKMGLGLSRAIFLTEQEKAGYAEPQMNPDGSGAAASYYLNDANALTVFNPGHLGMRWQGQHVLQPFMFTPVNPESGRTWDHNEMWANIQDYRNSYKEGRGGLKDLGKGKKLFIDAYMNYGGVGGIFQRKGWRITESIFKPYVIYKGNTDEVDVPKTWHNIEKIGYQGLENLVNSGGLNAIPGSFLKASKGDLYQEKMHFFKELFISKDYFGKSDGEFKSYMNAIRKAVRPGVLTKIKNKEVFPQSIEEQVEADAAKEFLKRTLNWTIARRFPTKFFRIDKNRFYENGKSRWTKVMEDLNLDSKTMRKNMDTLGFAESLLREEVSKEMKLRVKGLKNNDINFGLVQEGINYYLDADKIRTLLAGKVDQNTINDAVKTYESMKNLYLKDEFINGFDAGAYPFTFGLEDTDMSFVGMRYAGPRILARSVGDIKVMDQMVNKVIFSLDSALRQVATDGKKDFSPIMKILGEAKNAFEAVHGPEKARQIVGELSGTVINYFKKDTKARILGGLFGIGRKNSIVAEVIGRGSAVWEWDSMDIERYCYALESTGLLPKDRFDPSKGKTYVPLWITIPFTNKQIKLPFKVREPYYTPNQTTQFLREKFGGTWKDVTFDIINKYMPFMIAWLMWTYIKKAMDEAEGKKR